MFHRFVRRLLKKLSFSRITAKILSEVKRMQNGFEPLISHQTKTLIFGSAPSVVSLKKQEYYANPGNQFWPLFSNFYQLPHTQTYSERVQQLLQHRLGLWDVYAKFQRKGSSDQHFITAELNSLQSLFATHAIHLIILNGKKAAQMSKQLPDLQDKLQVVCPSTSGANNAQMRFRKQQWQIAYQIHQLLTTGILQNYTLYFGHSPKVRSLAYQLRQTIFVKEQGIAATLEFDKRDADPQTDYFVFCQQEIPIATIRFQCLDAKTIQPDRFCVAKSFRKLGVGSAVLALYETYAQFLGFQFAQLSAEATASVFYQGLGYRIISDTYLEDGILCCRMQKELC